MNTKIYTLNVDVLCRIYDKLNSWEWDDELGKKPDGWDLLPDFDIKNKAITKSEIIRPINKLIECIVGTKDILKYHHLNNLNRTEEEFGVWWNEFHSEGILA